MNEPPISVRRAFDAFCETLRDELPNGTQIALLINHSFDETPPTFALRCTFVDAEAGE